MKKYRLHFGAYFTADAAVEAESKEEALAMADGLRERAEYEYADGLSTEIEECPGEERVDARPGGGMAAAEEERPAGVFVVLRQFKDGDSAGADVACFRAKRDALEALKAKVEKDRAERWGGMGDVEEEWSSAGDGFSAWRSWRYDEFHYDYQIAETGLL